MRTPASDRTGGSRRPMGPECLLGGLTFYTTRDYVWLLNRLLGDGELPAAVHYALLDSAMGEIALERMLAGSQGAEAFEEVQACEAACGTEGSPEELEESRKALRAAEAAFEKRLAPFLEEAWRSHVTPKLCDLRERDPIMREAFGEVGRWIRGEPLSATAASEYAAAALSLDVGE